MASVVIAVRNLAIQPRALKKAITGWPFILYAYAYILAWLFVTALDLALHRRWLSSDTIDVNS